MKQRTDKFKLREMRNWISSLTNKILLWFQMNCGGVIVKDAIPVKSDDSLCKKTILKIDLIEWFSLLLFNWKLLNSICSWIAYFLSLMFAWSKISPCIIKLC